MSTFATNTHGNKFASTLTILNDSRSVLYITVNHW